MKLTELVERLNTIDEELIIFLENKDDPNSDIILSTGEEGDSGIKTENGKKFYYLIEVFLAKEFIDDWIESLDYSPNKNEIAKKINNPKLNKEMKILRYWWSKEFQKKQEAQEHLSKITIT